MKAKKVLIVLYNAPPLKSGAAMQALLLRNALKEEIDIDILSIDIEKVNLGKYKRIYAGKNFLEKILKIIYITHYISFSKYDVIHNVSLSKYTYLSVFLSKIFGKKVISKMTMFGIDDSSIMQKKGILNFIIKSAYRKLDSWIAIAPGMHDKNYSNIKFIPNSVNIPEKVPIKNTEEIIFLCSGVICHRKNQLVVLDYWENIQNDKNLLGKNKKLIFIGSYENDFVEYDNKYVNEFLKKVKKFDNIDVVGHTNFVDKYLEKATYYISFSTKEGLSNSLLEALAYNCYPIVYDEDKNTLIEELYHYGYYFNDFNNINIDFSNRKESVQELLKNNYGIDIIKEKYLDIYANK